jgi:large subunit ribosomal protein L24
MTRRLCKGDWVLMISGAERGKQGRVIAIDRERGKVRVEKVRMQKRHLKPGRKGARTGGIVEQEGFVDASNVMLLDSGTGKPDRVRIGRDGDRRIRVFAKSGAHVPDPVKA